MRWAADCPATRRQLFGGTGRLAGLEQREGSGGCRVCAAASRHCHLDRSEDSQLHPPACPGAVYGARALCRCVYGMFAGILNMRDGPAEEGSSLRERGVR
jgi:hypothetical protein